MGKVKLTKGKVTTVFDSVDDYLEAKEREEKNKEFDAAVEEAIKASESSLDDVEVLKTWNCRCGTTPVKPRFVRDSIGGVVKEFTKEYKELSEAFDKASSNESIELRNDINAEILERENENEEYVIALRRAKINFDSAKTIDDAARYSRRISSANANFMANTVRIEELKEKLKQLKTQKRDKL